MSGEKIVMQQGQEGPVVITIDGPAGTGKSTVARRLATRLGMEFLDTGAMYRAVAWKCLAAGISPEEENRAAEVARQIVFVLNQQQILVNGEDPGPVLRTPEVSQFSSRFAALPAVRQVLVEQQQKIASRQSLVTEGRDQGTVVFPNAFRKFFLTASPEVRAQRRYLDLRGQQDNLTFENILQEQLERDERDSSRTSAPLCPAEDATIVDTSKLTLEEVIEKLEQHVHQTWQM